MYKLYTIPGACSTAITILLEKLAVPYELINRDAISDYASINPTNQVPALQLEDGTVITEGGAIAPFLLDKHAPHAIPADPEARAVFMRWLIFQYATLQPSYGALFAAGMRIEASDEVKAALMQRLADRVSGFWAILDNHLADQQFVFGDEPTIMDYLVAVYANWNNWFPGLTFTLGANVKQLVDVVSELPEFKSACSKENLEYKKPA